MTPLYVQVPAACPESWAAMTPADTGRHCAACQKTVIDFTQKTDAEILAFLARSSGHACGRLRADQLGRPLVLPAGPSRRRAWLGALLTAGGLLGSSRASAQAGAAQAGGGPAPQVDQPAKAPAPAPALTVITAPASAVAPAPASAVAPAALVPASAGKPHQVWGTILDADTGEPMPFSTIILKGTTTGVSADEHGNFALALPASADSVRLTFSYIGYGTEERVVLPRENQPLTVRLYSTHQVSSGIMVIYRDQRPLPWHPRALLSWGKYWLTRPFRR